MLPGNADGELYPATKQSKPLDVFRIFIYQVTEYPHNAVVLGRVRAQLLKLPLRWYIGFFSATKGPDNGKSPWQKPA